MGLRWCRSVEVRPCSRDGAVGLKCEGLSIVGVWWEESSCSSLSAFSSISSILPYSLCQLPQLKAEKRPKKKAGELMPNLTVDASAAASLPPSPPGPPVSSFRVPQHSPTAGPPPSPREGDGDGGAGIDAGGGVVTGRQPNGTYPLPALGRKIGKGGRGHLTPKQGGAATLKQAKVVGPSQGGLKQGVGKAATLQTPTDGTPRVTPRATPRGM